jgi:hypothetical protein
MKQLSLSVLLLIALITGSCKKVVISNWTNANISFKIDGVSKEAKGDQNVFALYSKEQNILQIIGNIGGSGDEQIALSINNFHGIGEYTISDENFLGLYSSETDLSVIGTEGKIKITEFTEEKSIKGEFQFKGELFIVSPEPNDDPAVIKVFSEGKFEAKVTSYSGPITAPE